MKGRSMAPLADAGIEQIKAAAEAQQAKQIVTSQARQPGQRHTDKDQRRQSTAEDGPYGRN